MRKILFVLALILTLFSCSRDENQNELNGNFTEVLPIANRTQINFRPNNSLTIIKSGNSEDFAYQIVGSKIKLSNNMGYNATFEFERISDSEFKIENLYPSIPENTKSYLNFRK